MNDYISRADVVSKIERLLGVCESGKIALALKWVKALVIKIPAENVKPVVRGTWIIHNELVKNELLDENEVYVCSACREQRTKRKYNFCPNCGADMKGEENGEP